MTAANGAAPGWKVFAWAVCLSTLAHNTEELLTIAPFQQDATAALTRLGVDSATALAGF